MIFAGTVTFNIRYGQPYIVFEKQEDYNLLVRLVRKRYKLKTRKKRIVTKYVKMFLDCAIVEYIRNHHESQT